MVSPVKIKDNISKAPGRPRSPKIRKAILKAARDLMNELGLSGVTMEAVARRAGVGKPTVYRYWPNRHAVAMATLMDERTLHPELKKTRSVLHSLEEQLCLVAETLSSRQGRNLAAIIATSDPNTEIAKAFQNHFVMTRRNEGRGILEQGIRRKELRTHINIEVTLDQLYGALFFRVLLGHAVVDAAFVKALVKQVMKGLEKFK
ncbi:MAG: transcriptional regulator, TetR family [uncultured bacterium]|nr:MAG: transcriptional regulator, TetR family [uncultured bacterium]